MKLTIATCCFAALWLTNGSAQIVGGASGGGELSPTVVATWEAHVEAGGYLLDGPLTLDLLVLWRGNAGWFATQPSQGGSNQELVAAGGSDRMHRVSVRGRPLELRIDPKTNTARIQGQVIPLQGINVLLIDDVDSENVRIGATLWVDPRVARVGDPIMPIVRASSVLMDFARPR